MHRVWLGLGSLAAVVCSDFAFAQESETDPELAEIEKRQKQAEAEKAEWDALAAKYDAEKAAADKKFNFIPQSPAEGKVTLGDKAGAVEAEMLSAMAARAAAHAILSSANPPTDTLLVAGEEELDADAYTSFLVQGMGIKDAFENLLGPTATACTPTAPQVGVEIAPVAIGSFVSALAGTMRTDTEIRGVASDAGDAVLARAVSELRPDGFVWPSTLLTPPVTATNRVVVELCRLKELRTAAAASIPAKPPADDKRVESLKAAITRYDAFLEGLTKPTEKGAIQLASVLRQSVLFQPNRSVLRVHVDKAGGTLLTRRNLWTALGARAVGISGGMVASYTLSNPANGKVRSAVFICGTKLTNFHEVQKLSPVQPHCVPLKQGEVGKGETRGGSNGRK